jgi:uncharacterized protein (TIGR02284 family)
MATTIGTESSFVEMCSDLIELDFDAIEAYEAAIDRFESDDYKHVFRQFLADHERHVRELSEVVRRNGSTPPSKGNFKRLLTKGKVVLGNMAGDRGILKAMKTNEDDTNEAYERASGRFDVPAETKAVLERALQDERRHREWIEKQLTVH